MKTIKRTLALVIVFCLMISFVPVALAANSTLTITTTMSSLKVGSSVNATMTLALDNSVTWNSSSTAAIVAEINTGLPNGLIAAYYSGEGTNSFVVNITGAPTAYAADLTLAYTTASFTGLVTDASTNAITNISNLSVAGGIAKGDGVITITSLATSKTSNSITVSGATTTTGTSVQYAIILGSAVLAESDWHDPSSGSYTLSGLQPNTAYNVYARATASADYNASAASAATAVTTDSGTLSVIVTPAIVTYNGQQQSLIASTSLDGGTIMYSDNNGATYTLTSAPTQKDAGTYTVYYQITRTGYTTVTGNVPATINPAPLTATSFATAPSKAYDTNNNITSSTIVSFSGLQNGETLELTTDYTVSSALYSTADVGTNKAYSAAVALVVNSKTANYTLTSPTLSGNNGVISAVQLNAPTNVVLATTGAVSWNAPASLTGITSYSVSLYRVGSSTAIDATSVAVGTNTASFASSLLTSPGSYYATVTSIDGVNYTNSAAVSSTNIVLGSFYPASSASSTTDLSSNNSTTSTAYSIASLATGYTSSTASSNSKNFYIRNNGDNTLTGVSVSISNTTNFTLSTSNVSSSIASRNSASYFTLTPRTGASSGTWTTRVTITATNGTTKEFYVSFTVTGSSTISIRTTASSSSSDVIGETVALSTASTTSYTPSSYGKTFYVYNTGSSSLTGVSVSLSSTKYFTVYSSPSSTISSGSSSSFVIRPVSDLAKGSYSVTVTVSASNATSRTFTLTFKVGGTSNSTEDMFVNTSTSTKVSSAIDSYEFSDAAVGYAQPDPTEFYIHSNSTKLTDVAVTLSGSDRTSFTLDKSSSAGFSTTISKNDYATFTLVPKEGLKKGTYECTLTVSSDDADDYVIDVTFEVGTASLYFSTKKSGTAISSLEFDNAVEGYSISGTQTLYVNNDSGSQLKGVEVAISGTDKSSFKLTGGSLGTIKDGDYASFEIAPVAGLTAGTYTAKLTVSNTTNTKTATMTLSFKVTAGTGTVDTTPTPTASFVDTTSHWAKDYIESLYAQGYVSGIGSNQFAPNNTLTRAQFVQFLYNGFGSGAIASACPFADVDQTAWYKNAVNWAYANGLVTGYSSTEFGPNYPITREQMATIMGRLSEQYGVSLPSTNARAAFADDSDIASYAKDYVYKMQMADIISGKSGNVFDPKGNTTRGEMSKVMYYVLYYAGKIGTAYRVA